EGKVLKDGDILNIDVTVIKDGWHGDTSRMYYVGEPSVMARRLVEATREAMFRGIRAVRPGATLGDVGHAIQQYAESERFSVVREYCGHGIGKVYHDEPQVLHYGRPGTGVVLKEGMTFTIEPMINEGSRHTRLLPDAWTVVTKDRKLSAQWEHTVAVTADGVEILTRLPGDDNELGAPRSRGRPRMTRPGRPPPVPRWPRTTPRSPRASTPRKTSIACWPRAPARWTSGCAAPGSAASGRSRPTWGCSRSVATAAGNCSRIPTSTCWCWPNPRRSAPSTMPWRGCSRCSGTPACRSATRCARPRNAARPRPPTSRC